MYFFSGKYIINILKVYLKYTEFLQGYNCPYWPYFETLSDYKYLPMPLLLSHYLVSLHESNHLKKFCYPPSLPLEELLLCCVSIKFGGSLLVLRLSLHCDFPQAFGIACVLPSFELFLCLNLVRSSPCSAGEIRKALPRLLSKANVLFCARNPKSL